MEVQKTVITSVDVDADGYYKASIDLTINGDLVVNDTVVNFRVRGNLTISGNQYVGGNQDVGGNQYVGGNQDVRGYQYVGGNQDVRGYQDVGGNQDVRGYQDVTKHHFCVTRHFTGTYDYHIMVAITKNGERFIHMGCLHYSFEKWETVGIRKSNLSEFPDDGSERSEARVRAFEFAKQTALALKVPDNVPK